MKSGSKEVSKFSFQSLIQSLKIFRFIKPYRWHFAVGLVCLTISTAVVSFLPIIFRKLVDAANTSGMSSAMLAETGSMLALVLLIQSIFSFFRIWLFEVVSQNSMRDIRLALYQKIITLPFSFFDGHRTGELTSRLGNDVTQLQEALGFHLAMLIRQLILPLVCIPFLFKISIRLTLVMLAVFPPLIMVAVIFGRFIRKLSRKSQDVLADASVIAEETIQAADVVKSYTNEAFEIERYRKAMKKVAETALHAAKFRASFVSFIIFVLIGALVLVVWQGLHVVASGALTMGQLVEFLLYTVFIGGSLAGLSESYAVIQKTAGAAGRINELLEEQPEINPVSVKMPAKILGNISFDKVSFSYPSRKDVRVLSDLSFSVSSGERIALVGHSGSGKSTIIKLLFRYYDPDFGNIMIDGKRIQDYDLTELRRCMALVPQEIMLFGGTIYDNIAYGKPESSESEVKEAARKANALEFIESFPDGFNTVVGERGMKLSGGQKQRIAIARAIIRNPSILILDEATSALDSENEKLVKDALEKLMEGRTTFIIAHRLSTIRQADRIFVLRKGRIVEQGSHLELMKKPDSIYVRLVQLQYDEE